MKTPGAMLSELLGHLFKKPATVLYPFERLTPPDGYRGKIAFHAEKCISCNLCFKICPSRAIEMVKRTDAEKPKPIFKLDRCLFCAQCAEACTPKAIELTKEFEMACYKREDNIVR